jgi:PmbA protein
MLGPEKMREIAQRVLDHSCADQTEVLLLGEDTQLTRFANSRIHQNVAERNLEVRVRAVSEKKVGVATVNDLSDMALQQVALQALESAVLQPENTPG